MFPTNTSNSSPIMCKGIITIFVCFLSASKRQHSRFYRSFFTFFTFSKKISFLSILPTDNNASASTDCFSTFSLFKRFYRSFFNFFTFSKKNSFLSILPKVLLQIVLQLFHFFQASTYRFSTFSLFPRKFTFCQFNNQL